MIYFDYNTTTHLTSEVSEAIESYLNSSPLNGNDNSQIIKKSRSQVASLIGVNNPIEIIFTSGESENNKLAILETLKENPDKNHIITTTIESESINQIFRKLELEDYKITWLEVNELGLIDLNKLKSSLKKETALVSISSANPETGVLLSIEEIGGIIKTNSDAKFYVDGTNAVGKIPVDLSKTEIDLFSLDGHKFHAPKEIGALFIRDGLKINTQENIPIEKIIGIGKAAELVKSINPNVEKLRDKLENGILQNIPNARLNGVYNCLPNTSSISFPSLNGEVIMAKLDEVGIIVSTASPCNTQNQHSTNILQAMEIPFTDIMGTIRFSLGRYNTNEEVEFCIKNLVKIIQELNAIRY